MMRLSVAVSVLILSACLAAPRAALADIVPVRAQGYSEAEEFGEEVEFWTDYRTPNGIAWEPRLGPSYGVTGQGVEWIPGDLPVSVQLGTDRKGWWLLIASLIRDREGKTPCWKYEEIGDGAAKTPRALERLILTRVKAWTSACGAARAFGEGAILAGLDAARPMLGQALRKLSAANRTRFLEEKRGVGLPSFHPAAASQGLLDAIADACVVARTRLRVQADGTILFERTASRQDQTEIKGDDCVAGQIEYLPGFRRPA